MQNSRTYYGGAFLGEEDLKETNINHRIELEYYTITNKEIKNSYGIEVIKKEYKNNEINTEITRKKHISDSAKKVIEIIDMLP